MTQEAVSRRLAERGAEMPYFCATLRAMLPTATMATVLLAVQKLARAAMRAMLVSAPRRPRMQAVR